MVAIRRLVLGSCLIAAAVVAAPSRSAVACGMLYRPSMQLQPARADELLADAGRALDKSDWAGARRLALRVTSGPGPRSEQRAQAFAIAGLAHWQEGARRQALASFKHARQLDAQGKSIDDVLARVKEAATVAAVRAALEA
jgi:hypothetical protein